MNRVPFLFVTIMLVVLTACSAQQQTQETAPKRARKQSAGDTPFQYRIRKTVEEPIALYTPDSNKFAFHLRQEPETGNDVAYWGWNPPYANRDTSKHSVAFSMERDYVGDIEWNLDVRAKGLDALQFNSRPIHAMISAKTAYPKSLDFTFARMNFFDLQQTTDGYEQQSYASFSRNRITLNPLVHVEHGLHVKGAFRLSGIPLDPHQTVTPSVTIDWSQAAVFSFDLGSSDSCLIRLRRARQYQTIQIAISADKPVKLVWDASWDDLPIYWKNGTPIRYTAKNAPVTVLTATRITLKEGQDAILVYDMGGFAP